MYILNLYTPLFADDYSYMYSFLNGKRITNITSIISSQIAHYYSMNGRSIDHFLAQFLLLLGDNIVNIINSIIFCGLIFIVYYHGTGTLKKLSISQLLMYTTLIFLLTPAFGQSYLWIVGAANYLYSILLVLIFLIFYRNKVESKKLVGGGTDRNIIKEVLKGLLVFIFGIIAGWTNENTAVALVVIIICYIIFYKMNNIKLNIWNFTGLLGSIIGLIIMLLSPGVSKRLSNAGGSGSIIQWIRRGIFYSVDLVNYFYIPILIFVLLMTYYFIIKKNTYKKFYIKEKIKFFIVDQGVMLIYLIGFLASVYSMVVSPEFPDRAWTCPLLLLLISLGNLYKSLNINENIYRKIIVVMLVIVSLSTYFNAFFDVKNVYIAYQERDYEIRQQIAEGKSIVEIPIVQGWTKYSCCDGTGDLNEDENQWPNTAIAKYYGVDKVKMKR